MFVQGRYELQALDSHGIAVPGTGDCGAVYCQLAPLSNACRPAQVAVVRYRLSRRPGGRRRGGRRAGAAHAAPQRGGHPQQRGAPGPHAGRGRRGRGRAGAAAAPGSRRSGAVQEHLAGAPRAEGIGAVRAGVRGRRGRRLVVSSTSDRTRGSAVRRRSRGEVGLRDEARPPRALC
ncbi:uncharacterized protein SOCE836_085610 [Sorangium cellulosum]|uniref:Uncharacterized protein n=1 Tax=Sorangium cellulosum TaxID=56 RepID=A0A4P2R0B0_SORCE|nr:uncharacterized protein SOCE836_085610 [Sorangium cellulosum]